MGIGFTVGSVRGAVGNISYNRSIKRKRKQR